jgi:hypothetical protein
MSGIKKRKGEEERRNEGMYVVQGKSTIKLKLT